MANGVKTVLLLGALSGILLVIGELAGGSQGLMVAFAFAVVMNIGSYWFSDKIVLRLSPKKSALSTRCPIASRGCAAWVCRCRRSTSSRTPRRTPLQPGATPNTPPWRRPKGSCGC